MDTVRRQASLGTEFRRLYNEGEKLDRITLGKVVQVNFRYNTVDIQLLDNTVLAKSGESAGKFSAKIPVEFGGTTKDGKPFGQVQPLAIGTLVLVGFIDGSKNTPVVLSVYQTSGEALELSRAPFDGADPSDPSLQGLMNQHFKVFPSLTYEHVDGVGNRTVTFNGKSFMTMDSDRTVSKITDDMDGFDYGDLGSSYYYSGELIEPVNTKAPTILFKHQGKTTSLEGEQESDHMFMFFLGQDGTYRASSLQKGQDWRSLIEMTTDGNISLRHQRDTKSISGSKDFSQVAVGDKGVELVSGDKYFRLTDDGFEDNLGISEQLGLTSTATGTSTLLSTRDMLISQVYKSLSFGTKNLLLKSNIGATTTENLVKSYTMTEDFIEGADYTLTVKGKLAENQAFGVYQNGYKNLVGIMEKNETTGLYSLTFKSLATQSGYERTLLIYNTPFSTKTSATIEWGQLEKGSVGSDYKQAPEDVEKDIDQRMGTDRWIVNKYEATTATVVQPSNFISIQPEDTPSIQHLRGKKELSSEVVLDLVDSTAYTGHASSLFHLYTYLYSSEPKTVAVALSHTASTSLYVNGTEAYEAPTSGTDVQVTLVLIQGWNSIDIILNNVTVTGTIKFDKNFKELADAMSCYFGGGMSASQIRQLSNEIDLRVQTGNLIAAINLSVDPIDGARIEISGDTAFKDDVTMDAGVIKSSLGTVEDPIPYSEINLNAGTFSLGDGALTFNPTDGLTVDGTISAGNVKTGTMEGLNMGIDLDDGELTFVDPVTGDTLKLTQGMVAFWNGTVGRYLKYFSEGLVITPAVTNVGVYSNTGLILEGSVGSVKYLDFIDVDFESGIHEDAYRNRWVSEGGVTRLHTTKLEVHQVGNLSGNAPFGTVEAAIFKTADGANPTYLHADRWETERYGNRSLVVSPNGTGGLYVSNPAQTAFYWVNASAFNVTSSRDYKKDIKDYTGSAVDLINGTPVRSYYLNEDVEGLDPKRIGLIVQESPLEIVNLNGGDSIDTYEMSSLLWKGVQELSTELTIVKQELTDTKQELADLKALLVANGVIPA